MTSTFYNANKAESRPQYLDSFKRLNPHLRETEGTNRCHHLWDLLTPKHREDDECCFGSTQFLKCFTDHDELWTDTTTGMPVIVAHPYCQKADSACKFEEPERFLEERGLWFQVADSSWYHPKAALTVIARSDIIYGITLPGDAGMNPVRQNHFRFDIDWEINAVKKIAVEQLTRDRRVEEAHQFELEGIPYKALQFYCSTAYIDRTGGFHDQAAEMLQQARRVYDQHQHLETDFLYFHTERDRTFVIGVPQARFTESELANVLTRVTLPPEWEQFIVSERGYATCGIMSTDGRSKWGWAAIEQGGNMNRWKARVERNGDLASIASVANSPPRPLFGRNNFCYQSPHEAINEAVRFWQQFDNLLNETD